MNKTEPAHPFADLLGMQVDAKDDGQCTCSISFSESLLNPNNVVHGGVIYSLADNSMGGALTSILLEEERCATIEIKVTYLRPAGHSDLIGHSQVIKRGKRVAILESEIHSGGKLIAKASGSFAIF